MQTIANSKHEETDLNAESAKYYQKFSDPEKKKKKVREWSLKPKPSLQILTHCYALLSSSLVLTQPFYFISLDLVPINIH